MKNVSSEVFKQKDEIYVSLRCGLTCVTIRRCAFGGDGLGRGAKFRKKYPAVVSWSGGNGHETVEHATLFSAMIAWAAAIATTLTRSRDPRLLSVEQILAQQPAPPQKLSQDETALLDAALGALVQTRFRLSPSLNCSGTKNLDIQALRQKLIVKF